MKSTTNCWMSSLLQLINGKFWLDDASLCLILQSAGPDRLPDTSSKVFLDVQLRFKKKFYTFSGNKGLWSPDIFATATWSRHTAKWFLSFGFSLYNLMNFFRNESAPKTWSTSEPCSWSSLFGRTDLSSWCNFRCGFILFSSCFPSLLKVFGSVWWNLPCHLHLTAQDEICTEPQDTDKTN